MGGSRFPGSGANYRSNRCSLRLTTTAVAGLAFGGSKLVWFRTDALQVRNRVSPPKSMRDSAATVEFGTIVALPGWGSAGLLAMLRLAGGLGGFRRGVFESGFLRSKNCRVPQPPKNPRKPMAEPCTPQTCQTGAMMKLLSTDVETNGLSKCHSEQTPETWRYQATSNRPAAPIPPPIHMVTTTYFAPRRFPSSRA